MEGGGGEIVKRSLLAPSSAVKYETETTFWGYTGAYAKEEGCSGARGVGTR